MSPPLRVAPPRPNERAAARALLGGSWSPRDIVLVATDGDRVVGAAGLRLRRGAGIPLVNDRTPEAFVAVELDMRRRGVATDLVRALLDDAAGRYPAVAGRLTADHLHEWAERFGFRTVSEAPHIVSRRLPGVGRRPVETLRTRERHSAYAVCRDRSHLLLCRLCGPPLNSGWWTLPGGGIDPGEDPPTAARREVTEETGLTAEVGDEIGSASIDIQWHGSDGVPETLRLVQTLFAATITGGSLRDEPDGTTNRAAWVDRAELTRHVLVHAAVRGAQWCVREDGASADPRHVVAAHLAAVRTRSPELMIADYHPDAVLVRPDGTRRGLDDITESVAGMPGAIASGWLHVDAMTHTDDWVIATWQIAGGRLHGASGLDRFRVEGDLIVEHTVETFR